MTSYAGLDVSQQATQVCVVDEHGTVLWTGSVRSDPAVLAAVLRRRAPQLARAVLEAGPLSGWLCGMFEESRGHPTQLTPGIPGTPYAIDAG